jgi:glycosyltransferase involved in cell wall biosynthesis
MTKILLYTKLNFGNEGHSGISKKIFAQAKALRNLGFPTDLFYFSDNDVVLDDGSTKKVFSFENKYKRVFFQYNNFIQKIDFQDYTHVYIRHFFLHPLAIFLLWKMKKINPNLKIIMEIASFPYHEQARKNDWKDRFTYGLDKLHCGFLKKYVDVILTFSPFEKIFGIPTLRTSNGVDIDGIFPKKITPFSTDFHILGLANVQQWHGFDRIIEGMRAFYRQNPDGKVYFHIVGKGEVLPYLQSLVNEDFLKDKIIFHGAKYADELQYFFEKSHVAVSSLGMHRIGVANGETSNLKVREYCARGIPFINGYLDRDLPSDFPYVFQVEADEQKIDIQAVMDFYQNILDKKLDYPTELHRFAKENLTWEAKLMVVKNFLQNPSK